MELFAHAIDGKVLINVQARTIEAAKAATERLGRTVLIGVMAKDFTDLQDGFQTIRSMHDQGIQVSAGLGDGSASQWQNALDLALNTDPVHLNQIYPAAAMSHYALSKNGSKTLVNAMIKPTGRPGMVNLGTGPLSQEQGETIVSIDGALSLIKEMGVRSIKFFPIEGTKRLDEVRAVARAVAREDMILEPTGGITPQNVGEIVKACLEEGVRYLMPHLYGSLRNPETKDLDIALLETARQNIEAACRG